MAEYYIDQNLPKSEIVEAGYLEGMLKNLSSSYKLFWLKGIFLEVIKGRRVLEYKRIVARMIAAAWYPVVYYRLNLGYNDQLASAVLYLYEKQYIPREAKEDYIVEVICSGTDQKLLKMIRDFTNLVPYRLIRPFYHREIEAQKKYDTGFYDGQINGFIEQCNKNDQNNALYIMDRENNTLTVSEKWAAYMTTNAAVVEGWLNYRIIKYVQQRNPNVPAIPFKIFPPAAKDRNLTKAADFWRTLQDTMPVYDIYTDRTFTEENCKTYGVFSIDHFIPWSFVLHNEIWNLYPMFKNINSGKNNNLPDKDRYLERYCQYQYRAFIQARKIPKLRSSVEQYMTVKSDIRAIRESDRGQQAFITAMKQTIEPLYQIASNQGYQIWWYERNSEV